MQSKYEYLQMSDALKSLKGWETLTQTDKQTGIAKYQVQPLLQVNSIERFRFLYIKS